MSGFRASVGLVVALAYLLQSTASPAETVKVQYPEGVSHGFLVLRTLEGLWYWGFQASTEHTTTIGERTISWPVERSGFHTPCLR